MGYMGYLPPSRAGTKTLGVLSPSVASATRPSPFFPESHTSTQMVPCLGDAQSFSLLHWYFWLLKGGLML